MKQEWYSIINQYKMLPQLEIASLRTEIIPERKFDEACFLKFSPCFSVTFAHFGKHFSLMECVYVCILLDLLISSHFSQKFTRKLHCLHQITTPLFPRLINTLCLDSFPFSVLYISNVAIISKVISLSNIFRNADFYLICFCKWIMKFMCNLQCDSNKNQPVCVLYILYIESRLNLLSVYIFNWLKNCVFCKTVILPYFTSNTQEKNQTVLRPTVAGTLSSVSIVRNLISKSSCYVHLVEKKKYPKHSFLCICKKKIQLCRWWLHLSQMRHETS